MADNESKDPRRQGQKDDRDDDPFAELARIVGSDEVAEPLENKPGAGDGDKAKQDFEAELLRKLDADAEDAAAVTGSFEEKRTEESAPFAAERLHPSDESNDVGASADQVSSDAVFSEYESAGAPSEMESSFETTGQPSDGVDNRSVTSLEVELDQAFATLESGISRTQPDNEERSATEEERSATENVQPDPTEPREAAAAQQPVAESEDMAKAYGDIEGDIEAFMPASADDDEAGDDETAEDVNDLLIAEMIDVEAEAEAEATEAKAHPETPFDPAGIAESDDLPETMDELHVPQLEPEKPVDATDEDDDFDHPMKEALEALTAKPSPEEIDEGHHFASDHASLQPSALDREFPGTADALSTAAGDDERTTLYGKAPVGGFASDDDLDISEMDQFDDEHDGQRSRRKALVASLVVLGVAVVGGAGFYVWNSGLGGGGGSEEPLVIAADNDPVKVKPENPGGKTVPNQDLAVYDRVAGNDASTSEQQSLVNTTEEPVDVVQRTLSPETLPLEGRASGTEATQKSEDRLATSDAAGDDAQAGDSQITGLEPRKVRTLVVKPDGTIVARDVPETEAAASGDASGALTAAGALTATTLSTPVDATVADDTDTATTDTAGTVENDSASQEVAGLDQETASSTPVATAETPTADAAAAATGEAVANTATESQIASEESADATTAAAVENTVTADTSQTDANAPVPGSRPVDQTETEVAAASETTAAAASAPAAIDNPGGYLMQISSQPTEAGARQSYETLSQRYASIIGDRGVVIQRADIPDKGIFYRVRIPAGDRTEANDLCERYTAAGGSCFVAR